MKIIKRWTAKAKQEAATNILNNKDNLPDVFNYKDAFIYLEKITEEEFNSPVDSIDRKLYSYAKDIVSSYIDWYNLTTGNITYSLIGKGYENALPNKDWQEFLNKEIEDIKQVMLDMGKKYPPVNI